MKLSLLLNEETTTTSSSRSSSSDAVGSLSPAVETELEQQIQLLLKSRRREPSDRKEFEREAWIPSQQEELKIQELLRGRKVGEGNGDLEKELRRVAKEVYLESSSVDECHILKHKIATSLENRTDNSVNYDHIQRQEPRMLMEEEEEEEQDKKEEDSQQSSVQETGLALPN